MENMLGNGISQKDFSELLKSVVERVMGDDGAYWMKVYNKVHRRENPFEGDLAPSPYRREIKSWEKFYKKVFNETHDFSNIYIPVCPGNSGKGWWLVTVARGMKSQRLFEKCRDMFGAGSYVKRNLDEVVTSGRTAGNAHYAIWVRANVEADPQFENLSANKLKEINHQGITLEERLVLELFYFWKTKNHLDIKNSTLCSGSRYSGGGVPSVDWDGGRLGVNWCGPNDISVRLRSREVVL